MTETESAMHAMPEIIGRQSSHYTRLVRIFALELGVRCQFTPIFDLISMDRSTYAGNPALKLPILNSAGEHIYGSQNICRALLLISGNDQQVVWPEDSTSPLLMSEVPLKPHPIALTALQTQIPILKASLSRVLCRVQHELHTSPRRSSP